jgi:hypothetical protein
LANPRSRKKHQQSPEPIEAAFEYIERAWDLRCAFHISFFYLISHLISIAAIDKLHMIVSDNPPAPCFAAYKPASRSFLQAGPCILKARFSISSLALCLLALAQLSRAGGGAAFL